MVASGVAVPCRLAEAEILLGRGSGCFMKASRGRVRRICCSRAVPAPAAAYVGDACGEEGEQAERRPRRVVLPLGHSVGCCQPTSLPFGQRLRAGVEVELVQAPVAVWCLVEGEERSSPPGGGGLRRRVAAVVEKHLHLLLGRSGFRMLDRVRDRRWEDRPKEGAVGPSSDGCLRQRPAESRGGRSPAVRGRGDAAFTSLAARG